MPIERSAYIVLMLATVGGVCAGCAGHAPPSTYMPLDPVFQKETVQTGTIPIILFPDDPVEAVYDKSQYLSNVPTSGGGLSDIILTGIFNTGIDAINSSIADDRKRTAYQTALPVISELSQFDIKSDVARSLAVEMKGVSWLRLDAPVAISQKTFADKERTDLQSSGGYVKFLASIVPERPEHFYMTVYFSQSIQSSYSLTVNYLIYSKDDGIAIFRNQATFNCAGAPTDDWVSWWSENDGQRLRTAYTRGVRALAELIAYDLGARSALSDGVYVERSSSGTLAARCPEEWFK